MNGTNLFKIALRALANNKLRAFLTMLGIIIGVASVITMLAIGQGSKKSIQAQIAEMGSNMIMIHPGGDMRGGVRQDASSMQTLKLTDYEALRDETNFLAAVSPNVSSSGQLIAGNNNYPASVNGVGTEYLEIRQLSVESGEMFTEADIESAAKVCIIGKTIVDNLFPGRTGPYRKNRLRRGENRPEIPEQLTHDYCRGGKWKPPELFSAYLIPKAVTAGPDKSGPPPTAKRQVIFIQTLSLPQ